MAWSSAVKESSWSALRIVSTIPPGIGRSARWINLVGVRIGLSGCHQQLQYRTGTMDRDPFESPMVLLPRHFRDHRRIGRGARFPASASERGYRRHPQEVPRGGRLFRSRAAKTQAMYLRKREVRMSVSTLAGVLEDVIPAQKTDVRSSRRSAFSHKAGNWHDMDLKVRSNVSHI